MPNRYLRSTYVDSKHINKLSAEGERMFLRLLVHVDDFGRCEACPTLLRGKLFARQLDRVSESDVRKWVDELASVELIVLYQEKGEMYLQMNKWEKGRATKSKYPAPNASACKRMQKFSSANKSPDSDSDSDSDIDYDNDRATKKKKRTVFQKPTAEEVTEYAKSIGFDLDGAQFVYFYAAKGWKIGNSAMKDWKAAVNTWKRRRSETNSVGNNSKGFGMAGRRLAPLVPNE